MTHSFICSYLMELSRSQPCVEWLMITNNDLQRMWMDAVIHNLTHYPSISQEQSRKTPKKVSQNTWCRSRHLNWVPPSATTWVSFLSGRWLGMTSWQICGRKSPNTFCILSFTVLHFTGYPGLKQPHLTWILCWWNFKLSIFLILLVKTRK
jgi:hypothetical protein